jgi:hypothetical protein
VEKVLNKDMISENKLQHKMKEDGKKKAKIRELISQRFDRSKNIRFNQSQEHTKRVLATIERLEKKDKIHENLLQ